MKRLSNNDKSLGPVTIGAWNKTISVYLSGGDDEDPESYMLVGGFGRAVRLRIWNWLCPPWREKWVECNWDAETVNRLGRSGYWVIHPKQFGFSLSDMGNGYDFLQVFFGPQTHDSSTHKIWSKHLPWKQWDHARSSIYTPTGDHFYTEPRGAGFGEYFGKMEECPKAHFAFDDYDGARIVATCCMEEREWRKGSGWFRWLRWFSAPKIVRSLGFTFSAEVGPEKGSWKGGTIGHGIDMLPGESPKESFQRYCAKTHERKGRKYSLRFIGPCAPPAPMASATANSTNAEVAGDSFEQNL